LGALDVEHRGVVADQVGQVRYDEHLFVEGEDAHGDVLVVEAGFDAGDAGEFGQLVKGDPMRVLTVSGTSSSCSRRRVTSLSGSPRAVAGTAATARSRPSGSTRAPLPGVSSRAQPGDGRDGAGHPAGVRVPMAPT
jgi:hypothetical protein